MQGTALLHVLLFCWQFLLLYVLQFAFFQRFSSKRNRLDQPNSNFITRAEMKKKVLALIPYVFFLAVVFYLLPLIVKNTGMAMIMMLLIMPLLTFVCAVVYGILQGFNFLLHICVFILFSPTVFIFYNSSAWIYIIIYTVIAFCGNGLGRIFYKNQSNEY